MTWSPRRCVPFAILGCLCLTAGACATSAASPSSLVVIAPVALRAPFVAMRPALLGRHPRWQINFDFVAEMPTSLVASVPADVVATSDDATMTQLVDNGIVDAPHRLAHDLLEIAVPTANPRRIHNLTDLARTGARLAIVDPATATATAAGQATATVTARVLSAAHLHLATITAPDPAAALDLVATGAADAALVETSDFVSAPPGLTEVPITPSGAALVTYQIAVVKDSAHTQDARALAAELIGAGQAALRDRGFLSP